MVVLHGTRTSPFVRRVRIVAHELGLDVELVDSSTDAGQAALRQVSPVWKLPAAVIDGEVVLDSHHIIDTLIERHGHGSLRPRSDLGRERNLEVVVDGALDAAINAFYLMQGGLQPDQSAYLDKQLRRVDHALLYIAGQLRGAGFTDPAGLGLAELALVTTLDWMRFRDTWPVDAHPALVAFLAHWADRPALRETLPGR
jgi:glutathione S-transferase